MKILIGYDGSESSDAIFDDLERAGLPREGEAKIVSVADLPVTFTPEPEPDLRSHASRRVEMVLKQTEDHRAAVIEEAGVAAAKAAENFRSRFSDWNVVDDVKVGTPVWELLDAANGYEPDLLVIGSQGRSVIGRFFFGSVSKRLATDAQCSVRVVRISDQGDSERPVRIIVGVDGSPAAEEAIYAVGHRTWPLGTEVFLVTVDDSTPPSRITARLPQAAAMVDEYIRTREGRVAKMLEWSTEQLNAIGLETSVLSLKGDARTLLIEEARRWNADSIFVGTRDFKSAFERFRLGSVSAALVTEAPCSVEVVRPTASESV
jgi:nucleotide-binding universal stress UspA family protein